MECYNCQESKTCPHDSCKTADGKTVFSSNFLGRWVQYENGQQTQVYKGNTHPGEKGYNIVTSQSSMWDRIKHTMSNWF
jgi:hypothetical protein